MSKPTEQHDSGPLRFCVVGVGRIAQTHLEAFAAVPEATITAVVEPREAVAQATAEKHQCRYFTDHRAPELLDLTDVALICAPPSCHAEIATYFLSHGVHVLCEKPLTTCLAEAERLVRLAEEQRRVLMMASKFRYVEDVIKGKRIVESGILGKIISYQNAFCAKVAMQERWNSKPQISGGGVLIDNGCHSVDIARYLLGPIQAVQAQAGISAQGLSVEDTVRVQFRTRSGVIGLVDLSWAINTESETYIAVYGTEGTMLIGWSGARFRQDGSPHWTAFGTGYRKIDAFAAQLKNLIGTIRGKESPLITVGDAMASVQVIEAAYSSMSQDHWVPVEVAS